MPIKCDNCGHEPKDKFSKTYRWCYKCLHDSLDEYNHLDKNQKMIVRSARYCLLSHKENGVRYLWYPMLKKAINDPTYSASIFTFSQDVSQYYMDNLLFHGRDEIKRISNKKSRPMKIIYFKSGGYLRIFCFVPAVSCITPAVRQLLIDERISLKKPLTEILRK